VNAAERIAAYLAAQGLEQVFAVTGGGAMFLNQALAVQPSLRCSFMHHEQACAMAAEGYARIDGRAAIVNVTTGPGGLNALNGVFGAFTDSIPMIVLSGQVKRATALVHTPVPGLRQLGDQEVPITDMVGPIVKRAWAIGSLDELARALPEALALATRGRPGPVWLDIPIDLQSSTEAFDFIELPAPAATAEPDVSTVLEWLREAERPLILAGTGVRLAGAVEELRELVEASGIPLATAWTHDLIESGHPLFAGRPGTIGTRAGNLCLQAADLVIVIGSRLNIRQVSYNWGSFAHRARVVQVDIDPAEFDKPLVKPALTITADAKAFIAALRAGISAPSFASWAGWCRDITARFPAMESGNASAPGLINPYRAVEALFEALPADGIVASGNASACILPFQIGRLKRGQRLFSNSGSASMGYDLPAAIGASTAAPQRRVVCLAGDGSLQMNVQELQTLKTLQLNVAIVVLANDGYLSIRLSHENFFGRVVGADRASGVDCPDYVALAKAYGLNAVDIATPEELARLPELIGGTGPVLVQIHVDPAQGFSPKLKSRVDEHGKFLTPELDDMHPFLAPQELQAVRDSVPQPGGGA
jgi:acetolactate synthase-1/2/3 large subunit